MIDERSTRAAFVALLFAAMAAATLAPSVIGVLATFLIDEFDMSRGTLGWIVAANVIVAAALSPFAGALTDRVGGRHALVAVFAVSGVSFVVLGAAPAVVVLFVGSALAAVSQAGGNPSTNKLIGDVLPRGERGIVTGIKQSGVQAGLTLAGLSLPSVALAFGWRTAMLVVAVGPLVAAVVAAAVIPHDASRPAPVSETRLPLPASVTWLAVFGGLFGFAGAVTFYVPLFAEEALGFDPRIGGIAIAVAGAVAFAARIGWARFAERRHTFRRPLAIMAVLGIGAGITLLAAPTFPVLLWAGAILTGMSTSAWNSVGMLAVIDEAGAATGRASGVVLLGFLSGLGIGPPIYGALVDAMGGYEPMWIASIAAAALALGTIVAWGWTVRSDMAARTAG